MFTQTLQSIINSLLLLLEDSGIVAWLVPQVEALQVLCGKDDVHGGVSRLYVVDLHHWCCLSACKFLQYWVNLSRCEVGRSSIDERISGCNDTRFGEGAASIHRKLAKKEPNLCLLQFTNGDSKHCLHFCPLRLIKHAKVVGKLEHHLKVLNSLLVNHSNSLVASRVTDINPLKGRQQSPSGDYFSNPACSSHRCKGSISKHPQDSQQYELPVGHSQPVQQICIGKLSHQLIKSIIIAVPLAMKEQVLPDIPEEDMAQTQSMYEQLRKTTQKWFAPSHRRIFTSSPQPRHAGQSIPQEEKFKLLALMREQIEISCSEYTVRMGKVLQEQAKKIKLLGDLLIKNQLELNRKNQVIADLTQYIEQRPDFYQENMEFKARIGQSQRELKDIVSRLAVQERRELGAEKKHREQVQRIVVISTKKVREMSEEFQERVDKLQKIVALNQPDPRTHLRRNNADPALGKLMETLSSEVQDLRQDMESLRDKEYRYENYRLDQLESVLLNLKARVQRCEEKRVSALKSSQTTLISKTDSNYVPAKTRFLNKYKSLISSRGQRALSKSNSKSSSGSESEVQQTLNQDNIQRLRRIITQLSMKTPVRLQIDQTGYAKLADTGMYLVDSLGDGFQFTPQQLHYLASQKIIST